MPIRLLLIFLLKASFYRNVFGESSTSTENLMSDTYGPSSGYTTIENLSTQVSDSTANPISSTLSTSILQSTLSSTPILSSPMITTNIMTTVSIPIQTTTMYGYACQSSAIENINKINQSVMLMPTDKDYYNPGQNCSWQIFIDYPNDLPVLQIDVSKNLYGNDTLTITNCNSNYSLVQEYKSAKMNSFYTQEIKLCVNFVSSPNDSWLGLGNHDYSWNMRMSLTSSPIFKPISLTPTEPIVAVPGSIFNSYTQLTITASAHDIDLRIFFNQEFTPSPPSNYIFIYGSSKLENFIDVYLSNISYSLATKNAVTLLFSKDYLASGSVQIMARIPEMHGKNCQDFDNLLPAYPVNEFVLTEYSASSNGPCVFTILVPFTKDDQIPDKSAKSRRRWKLDKKASTTPPLTIRTNSTLHSPLPALSFDSVRTDSKSNVEIVLGCSKNFPVFGFNSDKDKELDGIVVYGNLISIIIPANESIDLNVTTLEETPSYMAKQGTKKGIISSSDYPNESLFQNTTKGIGCQRDDGTLSVGIFNLTVVYAEIPDDANFNLIANIFTNSNIVLLFSNKTVVNHTNIIFNATNINVLYVVDHTPNKGFLITYEVNCFATHSEITLSSHTTTTPNMVVSTTEAKPKDHSYIWITILAVVLFLFIVALGGFLYVYFKRKHERKLTRFLENRLESQRKETALRHECIIMKHNSDAFLLDEANLKVNYESPIGKGSSATVYRGHLEGPSPLSRIHKLLETQRFQDCDVAVKMAACLGFDEVEQLYREIDVMKQIGYHKHITSMLGWYLQGDTPCLVFELSDRDLLSYLRSFNETSDQEMPIKELISILWQIARGMHHIALQKLVHRDLAARNILLTKTNVAKISDFGLCCTCDETYTYHASAHKKLPMKWLSLEAINDRRFSEKSDVWAFGILMYEVFSRGKVPYSNMTIMEMVEFLKSGHRLACPKDATEEVYEIMKSCWESEPNARPTFEELDRRLRVILEKETEVYGYVT